MKKEVIVLFLLGILLISPLVLAEEQAQTYSGFDRFIDNFKMFFSFGDGKVMLALEIREKEVNSAMANIKNENDDEAIKNLESAINKLKIVQEEVSPDTAEGVKNNIDEIKKNVEENTDADSEYFEQYLSEEEKTKLSADLSQKVFDYCDELATQDYDLMLKNEKCLVYSWIEGKVGKRIEEKKAEDFEKIKEQISVCMNNPKKCDCEEVSLPSEKANCEKYKSLAIRCEFQNDGSACKEIGMFDDVQDDERENYEKEILEKYVPAECTEAGISDGEECKKYIIALYVPDSECMENGEILDEENCGEKLVVENKIPEECMENGQPISPEECESIMKKNSGNSELVVEVKECINEGYETQKECGDFILEQNLPQECINAGALTPEACEKLKLPQKCKGQAYSNEECEAVFIKVEMPAICQQAGTYDFHKCAKLLYSKVSDISIGGEVEYLEGLGISVDEIPDECFKDSSRTMFERDMDCDEALIKEFGIMLPPPEDTSTIPQECMKGGTPVSPEECEEILGNGIIQNDLQNVIPTICQEAKVSTPEECGKLLEKQRQEQGIGINMPEQCIGLDVEECKKIMQEKNITINKPEVNQLDDDMCEEGEEDCKNDDIITTGVPDECAKLGVYDKESCGLIMSKINVLRIKDGDKIIIDDDGDADIITNDQINQIADDADKKSDNIEPDTTKANEIKQEVDSIEEDIKKIDDAGDIQEPNGNGGDLGNGDNVVTGDSSGSGQDSGGNSGNSIADSGNSGGDSAPVTGDVISSEEKESSLVEAQFQTYSSFDMFIDNFKMFLFSADNKVMLALEIREKEINSAIINTNNGENEKAEKNLERARVRLQFVQNKVSENIAEDVKTNVDETIDKINEKGDLPDSFDAYILEEEKTGLTAELVIEVEGKEGQTLTREIVEDSESGENKVEIVVGKEGSGENKVGVEGQLQEQIQEQNKTREIVTRINEIEDEIADVIVKSNVIENNDVTPEPDVFDDDILPGPQGIVGPSGGIDDD